MLHNDKVERMKPFFQEIKKSSAFFLIGVVFCAPLFSSLFPAIAYATTGSPTILNQQGRLLDPSGTLLGGSSGTNYCFRFSLYDDATVGAPDNRLWPASTPSAMTVNVKSGVFNVGIGDTSVGGDPLNFDFNSTNEVYLNVEVANSMGGSCAGVSSFETLSPRQRIESAAYALNSNTVAGYTPAQSATGNQIPALTSGNLLLGATNPQVNATGANTLTLQSGATGNLQFFNSLNNLTSSGNLTLAGTFNGLTLAPQTNGFTLAGGTTSKTLTVASDANVAGTNTGDVALAGENYLSITGQTITANPINLSGTNVTGTLTAARLPAFTGDVTSTLGSLVTTIANNVVSFGKLQQVSSGVLLGRSTA